MTERAKKYLSDMLKAIELSEFFIKDISNFDEYLKDIKTQSAIERQLGIIGEAANQFRKEEPTIPLPFINEIVGFRNRIIHAYDNIDNRVIWAIITNHLPNLKEEVSKLL